MTIFETASEPVEDEAAVKAVRPWLRRQRMGLIRGRPGAGALGALAVGAVAVGAFAIGALAIGTLVVGRARFRRVEIDQLVVRRLKVLEP